MKRLYPMIAVAASVLLLTTTATAQDDAFSKEASIAPPSTEQVRGDVEKLLKKLNVKQDLQVKVAELWKEVPDQASGAVLSARLSETLALVHPEAKQVIDQCRKAREGFVPPDFAWLLETTQPEMLTHQLRLEFGRWLVQERYFDEGKVYLDGLETQQVVDPATLLFFQAVAYHRLLDVDKGLKSVKTLLEDVAGAPVRYITVGTLMLEDLKAFKEDSLDHIARQMDDVQRRLELARAGKRVRTVEKEIVDRLDKIIEEIEKQQQQQQQQQQQAGGGSTPSSPMQDSQIGGATGPGQVDPNPIGNRSGWGGLPPKEREKALQGISKDFPSHYRDVIEQYFRKLASESND